jgi:hypothetical protein
LRLTNIFTTGTGHLPSEAALRTTGYGIQSCGRLPKVYSNGGLIALAADSLTIQNAVNATTAGNVTIQPIVNITLMDLGNAGATNTFEKHAQQRSMGFQSPADA